MFLWEAKQTVQTDFSNGAKNIDMIWKTLLSALNQLNKIAVTTVLQLLLIPRFIEYLWIFYTLIWHMQQKVVKCFIMLLPRLNNTYTAWKVSIFGVFLVRIFLHFNWIRSTKTATMDNLPRIDTDAVSERSI